MTNQKPLTIPERPALGEILVRRRLLTVEQLEQVMIAQGRLLLPFGSAVIRLGFANELDVARALAEQWGVPAVDLHASTIATEVLGAIPREVAVQHRVMPLAVEGRSLEVAICNPGDKTLLDEVAFASGRAVLPFVVPRVLMEEVVPAAYQAKGEGRAVWKGPRSTHDAAHIEILQPSADLTTPRDAAGIDAIPERGLDAFPAVPAPTPRPATGRPCVLAVDDEPEILDIIERALTRRGMDVVRATRGREALERLRSASPDIVLLDAMLPEIHGFEICSQIKQSQHFRHIPVIMISAIYTGWNFIQDVKRVYGADEYLAKPFRVMELVRLVEKMIGKTKGAPASREAAEAHQQAAKELKTAAEAMKSGQIHETLEAARRAVQADPFDARAHFILGRALHQSGHVYEAISEYERVVELAPGEFGALKNLAVLYERQGFKAKSLEMWMRALEASPSDAVRQTIKAHLIGLL